MSQKKENKPCNQFEQGQGKQKKARSQQQVSDKSSLIGGAGNSNNGRSGWNLRPNGENPAESGRTDSAGFFVDWMRVWAAYSSAPAWAARSWNRWSLGTALSSVVRCRGTGLYG